MTSHGQPYRRRQQTALIVLRLVNQLLMTKVHGLLSKVKKTKADTDHQASDHWFF